MCTHGQRREMSGPGAERDRRMRTSQAERDRVVDQLRDHAAAGRLEVDELEERVERALGARTRGDLADVTKDLPRATRPRRRGAAARGLAAAAATAAVLPLIVGIAILAVAPPAFAWVGWTALGWWLFCGLPSAGVGMGFASCASRRHRRRRVPAV